MCSREPNSATTSGNRRASARRSSSRSNIEFPERRSLTRTSRWASGVASRVTSPSRRHTSSQPDRPSVLNATGPRLERTSITRRELAAHLEATEPACSRMAAARARSKSRRVDGGRRLRDGTALVVAPDLVERAPAPGFAVPVALEDELQAVALRSDDRHPRLERALPLPRDRVDPPGRPGDRRLSVGAHQAVVLELGESTVDARAVDSAEAEPGQGVDEKVAVARRLGEQEHERREEEVPGRRDLEPAPAGWRHVESSHRVVSPRGLQPCSRSPARGATSCPLIGWRSRARRRRSCARLVSCAVSTTAAGRREEAGLAAPGRPEAGANPPARASESALDGGYRMLYRYPSDIR